MRPFGSGELVLKVWSIAQQPKDDRLPGRPAGRMSRDFGSVHDSGTAVAGLAR